MKGFIKRWIESRNQCYICGSKEDLVYPGDSLNVYCRKHFQKAKKEIEK